MHKYFRDNETAPRIAYEYYLAENDLPEEEERTRTATAKPVYTLTGLPTGNVVQAIYVGTDYLYVDQTKGAAGGALQYISRYGIKNKPNGTLSNPDVMTLTRCGHTQSLQWDGGNHFWIGVKAKSVGTRELTTYEEVIDWATQIGRISYQPGATIDYTQIPRISSISRANLSGKAFGSILRCEVALTSDRRYLLVWSMNTARGIQFAYYKTEQLNKEMDRLTNNASKYSGAHEAPIKKACIGSYSAVFGQYNLPYNSLQGIEFANNFVVYINSDQSDEKYGVHRPRVSKKPWGTTDFETGSVYINTPNVSGYREAEGIQLKGDFIYMAVCYHPNPKTHTIVSIPKSEI